MTTTGPIAQVWCTGPNNKVYSTPGSFPIDYAGNCIYSVQPITVCRDDGSEDTPLNIELDMSDSLSDTPKSSIYLKNT